MFLTCLSEVHSLSLEQVFTHVLLNIMYRIFQEDYGMFIPLLFGESNLCDPTHTSCQTAEIRLITCIDGRGKVTIDLYKKMIIK